MGSTRRLTPVKLRRTTSPDNCLINRGGKVAIDVYLWVDIERICAVSFGDDMRHLKHYLVGTSKAAPRSVEQELAEMQW